MAQIAKKEEGVIAMLERKEKPTMVTAERPDFGPTQVRDREKIITGKKYVVHYTTLRGDAHSYNIKVYFKPPPDGCKGQESILVIREIPGIPRGMVIPRDRASEKTVLVYRWLSLSSLGIVPGEDGSWNQKSWLEDPKKAETAQPYPTATPFRLRP